MAKSKGSETAAHSQASPRQAALTDDPAFLGGLVERVVRQLLEAAMTAHLGATPYERGEARSGHRNGYKPSQLHTRVGTLAPRAPRDREDTFSTQLFARHQRSEKALVLALLEMYVAGVSTRKVSEITEALCGTTCSKSQAQREPRCWRASWTLTS